MNHYLVQVAQQQHDGIGSVLALDPVFLRVTPFAFPTWCPWLDLVEHHVLRSPVSGGRAVETGRVNSVWVLVSNNVYRSLAL